MINQKFKGLREREDNFGMILNMTTPDEIKDVCFLNLKIKVTNWVKKNIALHTILNNYLYT